MSVFVEFTIAITTVLLLLWLVKQQNKNKKFFKNIPGPPTLPILGNALDLTSTTALLKALMRYVKEYGDIVKIQIGPIRQVILITDYKFTEYILSSPNLLTKAEEYKYYIPWLGTGLLISDGIKWKTHRKILTPAFHFQILEQFIGVFESCGNILINKLKKQAGSKNLDIYSYVSLCTMDIICESTMGVSVNAQNNETSDYVQSVKDMTRIATERMASPIQMYDFLYPLTKNFYTQRKALKILHDKSKDVITQRRQKLKEAKIENVEEKDNRGIKKKKSFLDILLESTIDGRHLTQEEIREEVDTFMFEGQDTAASAISFTLYSLANNPSVQAKAYEEQQQIFGDIKNPSVTYTDLQNMRYLGQVIKETLRLYPPVPAFSRKTLTELEYGNFKIPPGTSLGLFVYGLHRNPQHFKDPEKFNPDRFNEIDGKLPYAYIPFSAGSRNCIGNINGQKFAMLEVKSTVSKILRTFELKKATPEHVMELAGQTTLKSANGVKMGLSLRH